VGHRTGKPCVHTVSSLCPQAGGKGRTAAALSPGRSEPAAAGRSLLPGGCRCQPSAQRRLWKWDPPVPFPRLGPGCAHQKAPSVGKGLGVGSAFPQLLVTQSKNRSHHQHWPVAARGAPLPAPRVPAPSVSLPPSLPQSPLVRAGQT